MIVSREEGETNFLEGYKNQFIWIKTASHSGPLTILDGKDISDDDIMLAAQISAKFSKGKHADQVVCKVARPGENFREISVAPYPETLPEGWLL
jgi:predicted ribosome quality control (RQC) complex YloA/Tae2 family protein